MRGRQFPIAPPLGHRDRHRCLAIGGDSRCQQERTLAGRGLVIHVDQRHQVCVVNLCRHTDRLVLTHSGRDIREGNDKLVAVLIHCHIVDQPDRRDSQLTNTKDQVLDRRPGTQLDNMCRRC